MVSTSIYIELMHHHAVFGVCRCDKTFLLLALLRLSVETKAELEKSFDVSIMLSNMMVSMNVPLAHHWSFIASTTEPAGLVHRQRNASYDMDLELL